MCLSLASSSSSHPHGGGGGDMRSAVQHSVYSTRHDARILSIMNLLLACSGLEESVIEDGDTLTFISTLHGG